MQKKGLLKFVGILFIIWSAANLLGVLGITSCAGIAGGALFGSVAAGLALGAIFQISSIVCYGFMLVAGVAGLRARNKGLCELCAFIILISAVITFVSGMREVGWTIQNAISTLISVALPVLYYIGVKRAF